MNINSGVRSVLDRRLDADSALSVLLDRINQLQDEVISLRKKKAMSLAAKAANNPDEDLAKSKIEIDVANAAAEIQMLKKSVPEGVPEDENVEYFLAVAELQETNEVLRAQLKFSEANLNSLNDNVKNSQEAVTTLAEVNCELAGALKKLTDDRTGIRARSVDEEEDVDAKKEITALSNKIRGTCRVYKEMKNFLTNLLQRIDPPERQGEDGPLALILQELWISFHEDKIAYLDISELGFDVMANDLEMLEENGIIERCPKDAKRIRMVNFTE